MKLSYIFNQDHLLVAPPGSEKHFHTYAFYFFLALIVACAAASLAIGTLYGEHDT